jgi:hypothetical protein
MGDKIAKLPNPDGGPQYFTTASEAATMDYVRVAWLRVAKRYMILGSNPIFRFQYTQCPTPNGVPLEPFYRGDRSPEYIHM